jgi:holo-[acyl-carrier protein] synthase
MIRAIGTDACDIARIAGLWQRAGDRFLLRICTPAEADYCRGKHAGAAAASLAARFAAKEAAMKCLGTGWADGIGFRQLEVVRTPSGAVQLQLHGAAATRARQLGIERWHLSLSHSEQLAIAFVVAEG